MFGFHPVNRQNQKCSHTGKLDCKFYLIGNGFSRILKFFCNLFRLQPGTDVMILPTVPDDDIRRLFPRQEITYRRVPSGRRYLRYFSNFN